jgi:hypothetical protein
MKIEICSEYFKLKHAILLKAENAAEMFQLQHLAEKCQDNDLQTWFPLAHDVLRIDFPRKDLTLSSEPGKV